MHKFVSFNLRLSSPQKINLPAISSAALYGKGIFTTLAVYGGKPFLWEKHWKRLVENAALLSINLSEFPEDSVKNELLDIIKKNEISNARARLTFFDESSGEIWKVKNNRETSLLITTADFRVISESLSLTVSPYPVNTRSPLINVKSCNYWENLLAFQKAAGDGFDEAIRLNERGEIASACLANIFWVKDGRIYTPSLKTGALAGTTREFVLENFTVYETEVILEEIKNAASVFLSSAGIGIVKVKNYEQIFYESDENLSRLENLFREFTGTFK